MCDLPHDILVEIAKRLTKLEDFVCFRCVSKSLFNAADDEYFKGLPFRQQTPYLMLPVRDDGINDDDDVRELYSLVDGESIVASVKVANFKKKKCLESLGWLLLSDLDGSVSLVDPFLGTVISLPHTNTFPRYEQDWMIGENGYFFQKMLLSSRPVETSDFVLLVLAGSSRRLAFWRLGDNAWNTIEIETPCYCYDVYYGGGQVYALSDSGIIRVEFNVSSRDNQFVGGIVTYSIGLSNIWLEWRPIGVQAFSPRFYFVKIFDDSLLILARADVVYPLSCMAPVFKVYKFDIATGTFKEIYSIGTMAVFLGYNSTIALDVSRFSRGVIKPNHIYFTDDYWESYTCRQKRGAIDSGVYNIETRTIEPIYHGEVLRSSVSPSTWITPCF